MLICQEIDSFVSRTYTTISAPYLQNMAGVDGCLYRVDRPLAYIRFYPDAGGRVAIADPDLGRIVTRARRNSLRAARMEMAAGRGVGGRWHVPRKAYDAATGLWVYYGYR